MDNNNNNNKLQKYLTKEQEVIYFEKINELKIICFNLCYSIYKNDFYRDMLKIIETKQKYKAFKNKFLMFSSINKKTKSSRIKFYINTLIKDEDNFNFNKSECYINEIDDNLNQLRIKLKDNLIISKKDHNFILTQNFFIEWLKIKMKENDENKNGRVIKQIKQKIKEISLIYFNICFEFNDYIIKLINDNNFSSISTFTSDDYENIKIESKLGILKAIDRFDINKNNRLITYATFWIRQAIIVYFHSNFNIIKEPYSSVSINKKIEEIKNKNPNIKNNKINEILSKNADTTKKNILNYLLTKKIVYLNLDDKESQSEINRLSNESSYLNKIDDPSKLISELNSMKQIKKLLAHKFTPIKNKKDFLDYLEKNKINSKTKKIILKLTSAIILPNIPDNYINI